MVNLNRRQISQLWRPAGPKSVQTGIAVTPATGGSFNVPAASVDLSLPIHALRFILKGRLVIGTANFTSVNPEGFLNILPNIKILGTNKRQGGNVTLYDIDLATHFVVQHLFTYRAAHMDINGAEVPVPTMPFPAVGASGFGNGATGTYDFRIVVDFPFHPFEAGAGVRPGFLVRQEEWKDSMQIQLTFGTQAGAGASGFYGVSAGTTTVTWSGFGSGAGNPTLDIYSLPVRMGLDIKDKVTPGFITRVQQPVNAVLQTVGSNVALLNLQKQKTGRIYVKTGTSVAPATPAFATLSDTNVTAIGLSLGGNRSVKDKLDIFSHKQSAIETYDRDPIQGYFAFDFLQSGNPDSAYPGKDIGDGTSYQLIADVAGVANGYGIIVQEQTLYDHEGELYTF